MAAHQFQKLLGCNVYVSEGRNLQLIKSLQRLCQQHRQVVLANTFIDEPYNRTGLTLASSSIPELTAAILSLAQHSLAHLDLRQHAADHPRLGVLDHISMHPLGTDASLQLAGQAAVAVGQQLAAPPLQLPVYFYGAAHPEGRTLAETRRNLGYFKGSQPQHSSTKGRGGQAVTSSSSSSSSMWEGSLAQTSLASYPPDAGPAAASPAAGVVTVGAVPWVVNYNVPLHTLDMAAARAVARAVSTRGGGLPGVEAMALPHGPGVIEIATNLIGLDWRSLQHSTAPGNSSSCTTTSSADAALQGAGPHAVAAAIAAAAAQQGLPPPGAGYITNKLPHQLLEEAGQQLSQL